MGCHPSPLEVTHWPWHELKHDPPRLPGPAAADGAVLGGVAGVGAEGGGARAGV